jgi:quinol monooxygenase YgiN
MTVVVLLDVRLKTDALDESYAAVAETLSETRRFPGCVKAEVLIDSAEPAHLVVVETWESADADAAYRAWRRGDGAPVKLAAVLTAPPVLTYFSPSDKL